jgi:hypothetical protein
VLLTVLAWLGRAVAAATAVLFLASAPDALEESLLGAASFAVGAAFAAMVVASFRRTRQVGWWLLVASVWAMFTWYGVVAIVDPATASYDAQITTTRRGSLLRSLMTVDRARVVGVLLVVAANAPIAVWLWGRTPWARRHRERRLAAELPPGFVPPPAVVDPVTERRQRARRRRKRKLKRR